MILSASRRTDIPAFYSQWLVNRLREGMVLVRNPMNYHQISRIALSPANFECVAFWSKNPGPMLQRLATIDDLGYHYYFLFTLTSYEADIEVNVPEISRRIAIFRTLAEKIGKEKVIWRYDPILFTDCYTADFHTAAFGTIASQLAGFTEKCIVSFVEMYRKCTRNLQGLGLLQQSTEERMGLLRTLRTIATGNNIRLQTCAAGVDLEQAGITAGKCIDDQLIAKITGSMLLAEKDKNQRRQCGCISSIDIGAYNSCPHGCLYCYANHDQVSVTRSFANHNPSGDLLYGVIDAEDKITERKIKPLTQKQLGFLK